MSIQYIFNFHCIGKQILYTEPPGKPSCPLEGQQSKEIISKILHEDKQFPSGKSGLYPYSFYYKHISLEAESDGDIILVKCYLIMQTLFIVVKAVDTVKTFVEINIE